MGKNKKSLYPPNWKELAFSVKSGADWKCSRCGLQCLRPEDDASELSRSERATKTLMVHHWNRDPSSNNRENLGALCSACHLNFHTRRRSNISPGQLSLF